MRRLREGTVGVPSLMVLGVALVAGIEHTIPPWLTSNQTLVGPTIPPRVTGEHTTPPRITPGKYYK